MALRGLARLRVAVHATPAAHDPFDVLRRAGAPDPQQQRLGLGRRHAGQRADLGVRELATGQRLGQQRQGPERARDSYLLPRGAQVEAHAPTQPGGARAESDVPAPSGVELADEIQESRGRRFEVRRQLGDRVAQSVQVWREILHGEPPLCWGDSTPEFRGRPGGTTRGDRGTTDIFRDEPNRRATPAVRGPLGRYSPRAADIARRPRRKLSSGNCGASRGVPRVYCRRRFDTAVRRAPRLHHQGGPLRSMVPWGRAQPRQHHRAVDRERGLRLAGGFSRSRFHRS